METNEETLLNKLDKLYWQFHSKFKKNPKHFKLSRETLILFVDEMKASCPWYLKPTEQMIEEGVRHKNVPFFIDDTLELKRIIIN